MSDELLKKIEQLEDELAKEKEKSKEFWDQYQDLGRTTDLYHDKLNDLGIGDDSQNLDVRMDALCTEFQKRVNPEDIKKQLAQAIQDEFNSEWADYEEISKECPEDEPVQMCLHDVRAMAGNVIYQFMHKNLGYHFQKQGDQDVLVEGPLFPPKTEN